LVTQLTFAKDKEAILSEARQYVAQNNFEAAISSYKEYVKTAKNEDLKEVYFEFANCYYKNNEAKMAVKTLKTAIKKYGLTEEDLIYSPVLDEKLSDITIAELYDEFTRLRNRYVTYHEKQ
jgi:tetratricopeptide (TPR) repeat protein